MMRKVVSDSIPRHTETDFIHPCCSNKPCAIPGDLCHQISFVGIVTAKVWVGRPKQQADGHGLGGAYLGSTVAQAGTGRAWGG